MRIAVDAMGGDYAPRSIVEGAILSARERGSQVTLVGDQAQVGEAMQRASDGIRYDGISLYHASQIITMGESPAAAVKVKGDSSVAVCARLVRERRADAMVSAGNTGACMAAAMLALGRLEGVQRPAIALAIPHARGATTLIDAGANVDCRSSHLAQFAVMGEVYAEQILGIRYPRIGLLNVGEEEGKGTEAVQEAYGLLRRTNLNFIGNVEGRDVTNGRVDVIVCDGFVGNIVLKLAEGIVAALIEMVRDGSRRGGPLTELGALLSKPVYRRLVKRMDPTHAGGAPLLGLNGSCIIGHGSSSPLAISNAIALAERFVELKINSQIRERIRSLRLPRGR